MAHVQTFGHRMIPLIVALRGLAKHSKGSDENWGAETCQRVADRWGRVHGHISDLLLYAARRLWEVAKEHTHCTVSALSSKSEMPLSDLGFALSFDHPYFGVCRPHLGQAHLATPEKRISRSPLNARDQVSSRLEWDNNARWMKPPGCLLLSPVS